MQVFDALPQRCYIVRGMELQGVFLDPWYAEIIRLRARSKHELLVGQSLAGGGLHLFVFPIHGTDAVLNDSDA